MFDQNTQDFAAATPTEQLLTTEPQMPLTPEVGQQKAEESETRNHHAEAGRKGAQRIHELIQYGQLYEQEHGLKRGRQRIRQLIAEGKLYEQEHGLHSRKPRGNRLSRRGREQVLGMFLESLLRMSKPAFRARLRQLLDALDQPTV